MTNDRLNEMEARIGARLWPIGSAEVLSFAEELIAAARQGGAAIEAAVAEEREAIARIFDKMAAAAEPGQWGEKLDAEENAAMIRARGASKTSIDVLKRPNADHLHAHIDEKGRTIASFESREDAEAFRNYKRFTREYPQVMSEMERPRTDDVDHVAEEFDVTDHTAAAEIEAIRAWDKAAPAMTRDESLRFRAILEDAEAEIPDHLK